MRRGFSCNLFPVAVSRASREGEPFVTKSARVLRHAVAVALQLVIVCGLMRADESRPSQSRMIAASRPAVVAITSVDRTGESGGLGSGFLVQSDAFPMSFGPRGDRGVVVTNFHVIGQGRRFRVQLANETYVEPQSVLAYDRGRDLALVEVKLPEVREPLRALRLGDSEGAVVGTAVSSLGHPLGFRASVARGVIASRRELGGQPFLQLAMPIEPGNSGGPILDAEGRVLGVVTIKSGDSVGFAIPSNDVAKLLAVAVTPAGRARAIPLARWATIGALDPARWRIVGEGGSWRQRAGRLVATGAGSGVGGRMFCRSLTAKLPAELDLEVDVKLADESGAAGLAFRAGDSDTHYGFYPTSGALRLARFEGPTVFSWQILATVQSVHYRPGEWNRLRVEARGDDIVCSVNGQSVIELEDSGLAGAGVGLVKFREPTAEFRRFRHGRRLPASTPDAPLSAKVIELASRLSAREAPDEKTLSEIAKLGSGAGDVLDARARELEREAERLRHLAERVRRRQIEFELASLFAPEVDGEKDRQEPDLLRAALLVARADNAAVDIEGYTEFVDRIAEDVRARAGDSKTERDQVEVLLGHLFGELGFHGSFAQYYHRSNSYLNEVLDDREGLPITLSLVVIECGRRLGLPLEGVGAPYHFLVRYAPKDGESELIDAFGGGKFISREEAEELCGPLTDALLPTSSAAEIVIRILRNLIGVAQREGDLNSMLRYLDLTLVVDASRSEERWMRAVLRSRSAQPKGAEEDLRWLLEHGGDGVDRAQVEALLRRVSGA